MKKFMTRLALAAMALACGAAAHASPTLDLIQGAQTKHPLIYSHDEMFNFDIEAYLVARAPALAQHAEAISHWAGYTSISPRVLLTLLEMQTGLLSSGGRSLVAGDLARPFGNLSSAASVADQVRDVADQMARQLYADPAPLEASEFGAARAQQGPLQAVLARGKQASPEAFADTYQRLFGNRFDLQRALAPQTQPLAAPEAMAAAPNGLLRFPFPWGANWHVGGAHTNTGSGNYPMSSLDMSQGGGWGSNQSNVWVSSSAAGQFKRHSSCFAEIVHTGGWSTTYYHLMNIQYNTGANVGQLVRIANPANTQAQALCNGGHSTGPHEHFSVKQNGAWQHLNGAYISGYRITAIGTSYDTNCNRFYLVRNGVKKCSGWFVNN